MGTRSVRRWTIRLQRWLALGLLLAGLLLAQTVSVAHASTWTVASGDSTALINALQTANSNGQPDTIILADGCTYPLAAAHNNTYGANGLPTIRNDGANNGITIIGNNALITRSGSPAACSTLRRRPA